jgi:hypothetical protein
MSVQYELTSWRSGHNLTCVRGGGGATIHISTESSKLEKGGGAVQQRLKLPTSWREGGGAVWLEGEENTP